MIVTMKHLALWIDLSIEVVEKLLNLVDRQMDLHPGRAQRIFMMALLLLGPHLVHLSQMHNILSVV